MIGMLSDKEKRDRRLEEAREAAEDAKRALPDFPIRELGLTFGQIAKETGLSPGYISRVMRGERTPSLSSLVKIARCLGMPEGELLKRVTVVGRRRAVSLRKGMK